MTSVPHSPRMRPPIGAAMNAAISMTFMPSRSFRAMCFLLFQKDCSVTGGPVVSGARRLRGSCPAVEPNGWRAAHSAQSAGWRV